MEKKKLIGLVLGPLLFALTNLLITPEIVGPELWGLTPAAIAVLASTFWIVTWWITEAVPIPVTSLLPIILFPITGAVEIGKVTPNYAKPMIFLFLGGFILALAMEKWNLHRRIALSIIAAIGTQARLIVLGFMLATAFLSMWISNTATTMMMVPIALAIISQISVFLSREENLSPGMVKNRDSLGIVLLLSIAYSASIGGLATLIGTPTNIIFSGFIKDFYTNPEDLAFLQQFQQAGITQSAKDLVEISFMDWFKIGFPVAVIMIFVTWFYLVRIAFPLSNEPLTAGRNEIQKQLKALGKISPEEKRVLVVFTTVAFLWMMRKPLTSWFDPWLNGLDDNIIALIGGLSLFVIPSNEKGKFIMDWKTANKLPWGILLLFGGGFALATGFKESELANWMANGLEALNGIHLFIFILAITALVNFLTELTMNVATITMVLPILAALAISAELHPFGLMVAATMAASCAFMLPIATAPNAIVFGAGYIKMKDMIRAGFALNIISIALISVVVYFLLGFFWHINLG